MSNFWQSIVVPDSPETEARLAPIENSIMSFLWDRDIVAREGVEETPGFPEKKWYGSRPNAAALRYYSGEMELAGMRARVSNAARLDNYSE